MDEIYTKQEIEDMLRREDERKYSAAMPIKYTHVMNYIKFREALGLGFAFGLGFMMAAILPLAILFFCIGTLLSGTLTALISLLWRKNCLSRTMSLMD